jgi:hypothetical protein
MAAAWRGLPVGYLYRARRTPPRGEKKEIPSGVLGENSAMAGIRALLPAAFVAALSMGAAPEALATAAGPDEWAVTGIRRR